MKRILNQLMMVAALMGGAMSLTSCLFGEVDNPIGKTEAEIEIEQVKEVVALLEEAQETGSLTSMYYTLGDTDYEAVFKKEGDSFVLQELKSNKAATRHWEDLGTTLEVVHIMTVHEGDGGTVNVIEGGTVDNINIEKRPEEKVDISGSVMEEPTSDPDPATIKDEHGVTWEIDDDALYDNFGVANSVDYQWTDEDEEDYQNPVDEGDAAADDEPAIAPADQALHFMVTDKATGEVLIDSYTNLGNLETEQQTVDAAQVKDQVTVNGKTKETNKAPYYCEISLPNKNKVKITYNKKETTWAQLADSQKNLEIKDKKVAYKIGHKYYWVLKDQYSGLSENTVVNYKEIYKSSAEVKGIRLYTNVDKSVYSTTWEKNQFRNGDKFQVRIEFSKNSDGAKMRDKFNVNVSKGSVTVEHVTGTLNVFEITANVAPTGEKKVEEFEVNFGYCDYNRLIKTCTLTGGVNLYKDIDENTPPAAEIDALYTKMDKEGWTITADYAEYPIGDFIGEFKIQTLTEPYAKALAEKISSENSLSGVAILMDGNTESGFDLYVLNGSSSGKVHLAADEKPTSLVGLTLFYIKKEDKE